eukprot:CAMPEP_0179347606 /NCGR_PEP_ID=MMETSP0797-20121207/73233_1 /TAXON_ID=47934 /ORGANISM="Dinophysis acuminata, Strain DAEP01" /LENGTH=66 /DNA_ID=CAMNT_0021062305 /DNA_START=6 /DNA_END=206 /DNA_ORIENTATION=+
MEATPLTVSRLPFAPLTSAHRAAKFAMYRPAWHLAGPQVARPASARNSCAGSANRAPQHNSISTLN